MARITSEQARDYLARWRQVADAESRELRSTSMDVKLRQLAALFASAKYFPESKLERQRDSDEISRRWASIRKACGV